MFVTEVADFVEIVLEGGFKDTAGVEGFDASEEGGGSIDLELDCLGERDNFLGSVVVSVKVGDFWGLEEPAGSLLEILGGEVCFRGEGGGPSGIRHDPWVLTAAGAEESASILPGMKKGKKINK